MEEISSSHKEAGAPRANASYEHGVEEAAAASD